MVIEIVNFANLLLAALLAGSMFGIWLIFNPAGLDANAYIVLQQRGIQALNKTMPILGGSTILATAAAAWLNRNAGAQLRLLIATLVCFVIAGFVTRFLNQPINAVVLTWSRSAPPSNWADLRDQWWRWHIIRTIAGLVGLSLLIIATLR
jgi:uncharacterized membrane protein